MNQHHGISMFDNEVPDVIQNPATIGVFQSNSVLTNGSGNNSNSIFGSQSNSSSSAANDPNQATRETGIIEKLLVIIEVLSLFFSAYAEIILNSLSVSAFIRIYPMLRASGPPVFSLLSIQW